MFWLLVKKPADLWICGLFCSSAFWKFDGAISEVCVFFCFYCCFGVCRSGVARLLVTFFASPKRVTQKRRPRCHCPSGSQLRRTKNGKVLKLAFGSNSNTFFIHFLSCTIGSVRSGLKSKSKSKSKTNGNIKTISIDRRSFFNSSCRSLFLFSLLTYPIFVMHRLCLLYAKFSGLDRLCRCNLVG